MEKLPQKSALALVKNSVNIQASLSSHDISSTHVMSLRKNYSEAFAKLLAHAKSSFAKAQTANAKKHQLVQSIMNFSNAETIADSVKPLTKEIAVPKILSNIKKLTKDPKHVVVLAQHIKALSVKSPKDFNKYKVALREEFKSIETLAQKYTYTKNYLDALTLSLSQRGGGGDDDIDEYIFFSDEEGQGIFINHLFGGLFKKDVRNIQEILENIDNTINEIKSSFKENDIAVSDEVIMDNMINTSHEYIDTNTKLVFLGDAVDRGDRGKNELDLLKILVHLSKKNKMLLLAGNRDINKMRMRYEFAITLTIKGLDKEIDAYEVLYYYVENRTFKDVEKLVKNISKVFDLYTEENVNNIESQIWIALAYQFLTRIDVPSSLERNSYNFDENLNITKASWTFNGDLVLKKYWGKKGPNKQKGGNPTFNPGNKFSDYTISLTFNSKSEWELNNFIANNTNTTTNALDNTNSTTNALDNIKKEFNNLLTIYNKSENKSDNSIEDINKFFKMFDEIEHKYEDSEYPPPNKNFLKNVYTFLEYKSANRVSNLLGTYGIQNVDKNYVNWVNWAKAALSDFKNLGLYVEYLQNCKFFHKIQLKGVKIICSHSIASKDGILLNLGKTDTITAGDWPIQGTLTNIFDGTGTNTYRCKNAGCDCGRRNIEDLLLLQNYMNNIDKAPSYENDSILKIVTQAVGIPPGTVLKNPNGDSENNTSRDLYNMVCFLKDEGKINADKTFIVHGHQPFGIPYSQDVKIIDGDGDSSNKTHIIKRICVDVSRDGGYSGEQYDPISPDKLTTLKNWAYVTFSFKNSTNLKIEAIGQQHVTKYTIPNMRKLIFKSIDDIKSLNRNLVDPYLNHDIRHLDLDDPYLNDDYNYLDRSKWSTYVGVKKDKLNQANIKDLSGKNPVYEEEPKETQTAGKSKKPRSKKSK